ncbi:MAG: tRNA (N(6)-L-threonylcarbamoyladenosine(37)-C(2))-methylthiotransferase MtaB [Bacteroidales bacterium]|nr:tRNA (N(6)-L-threonylcarbamoyladenosine(37)-C(2))-methylthiotransferase MtaB [Bacteroidales bacterium]
MKIAFTTLGCKLNYAETSTYERSFKAAGWDVVPWSQEADMYLVNTCAVTETAEKKSRNLIRRAHKTAPDARIVVTGCYAQLRKEQLLTLDGVWKVFGAEEKKYILDLPLSAAEETLSPESSLRDPSHASGSSSPDSGPLPLTRPRVGMDSGESASSAASAPQANISNASSTADASNTFGAYSTGERTRSFLKVQDGCNNFCAYCTVPYARGRSRNIPVCECVKMARSIAAEGVKEVVLTGVNTGDFGRTTGESFLDLLKALNEVEGIERFRISSIEPNLITPEIVDWIASGTKFQPHFHIPLQSGSDTLLRRVGRRYDTALFASRIDYIRQAMGPSVFFGIDVIVGLPGETEELFEETYAFLERVRPAFIHVFPYSRRPGTRAAEWKDQVQDRIKTERVARLEELCERLHGEFVAANKGLRTTVLWESSVKNGLMGGYSSNYIRVERPYDKAKVNTLEEITL